MLATDANFRNHYFLGPKKLIPWLSVYKAQAVELKLIINVDTEFLKDSMTYIKINASNTKIKANITTISGNTINFSHIKSNTNMFDLAIIVEDYLDNNQYLYFADHTNDTLL